MHLSTLSTSENRPIIHSFSSYEYNPFTFPNSLFSFKEIRKYLSKSFNNPSDWAQMNKNLSNIKKIMDGDNNNNIILNNNEPMQKFKEYLFIPEFALEICRIGEEIIFAHLSKKNQNVIWQNKYREKGLPYDISYQTKDKTTIFVEVKTTSKESNDFFPVSCREIEYAVKNACNYRIFFVYLNSDRSLKVMETMLFVCYSIPLEIVQNND